MPLEQKTVRFIDNFSTGGRGAALAEALLARGYAVVFLHRRGSKFPFSRRLEAGDDPAQWLRSLAADPFPFQAAAAAVGAAFAAASDGGARLHAFPFTSVAEYLALLRLGCEALKPTEVRRRWPV